MLDQNSPIYLTVQNNRNGMQENLQKAGAYISTIADVALKNEYGVLVASSAELNSAMTNIVNLSVSETEGANSWAVLLPNVRTWYSNIQALVLKLISSPKITEQSVSYLTINPTAVALTIATPTQTAIDNSLSIPTSATDMAMLRNTAIIAALSPSSRIESAVLLEPVSTSILSAVNMPSTDAPIQNQKNPIAWLTVAAIVAKVLL